MFTTRIKGGGGGRLWGRLGSMESTLYQGDGRLNVSCTGLNVSTFELRGRKC